MSFEEGFFVGFARAEKVYRRMCARAVEDDHFTPNEIVVLMFLSNNPALDTAKDIALYRGISKGLVARSVESLCGKGYLIQARDRTDRRLVRLRLSARSARVVGRLAACREKFCARLFRGLPEEYPEILAKTLAIIEENMNQMIKENLNQ